MKKMSLLKIFLCLLLFCVFFSEQKGHKISKRHLLFPRATYLQFTYGLSSPLILPRRSINLSLACQTNYDLPYNLTLLQIKTISARKGEESFDFSRETLYKYLIELFDNFNLNGEQCLLRTICEISEYPMYLHEENLLEEIVHFIFTPSLEVEENSSKGFENELLMAEEVGKRQGNCHLYFPQCDLSIVDLFTMKYIT